MDLINSLVRELERSLCRLCIVCHNNRVNIHSSSLTDNLCIRVDRVSFGAVRLGKGEDVTSDGAEVRYIESGLRISSSAILQQKLPYQTECFH